MSLPGRLGLLLVLLHALDGQGNGLLIGTGETVEQALRKTSEVLVQRFPGQQPLGLFHAADKGLGHLLAIDGLFHEEEGVRIQNTQQRSGFRQVRAGHG